MTKFSFTHSFDVSVDKWVFACLNPLPGGGDLLKKLDNVQDREVIEKVECDRFIKAKVRYCATGIIPKPLTQIIKPHMLSWIEETTFDKAGNFWTWNVSPNYFRNIVESRGKMSIIPDGERRCRRVTAGFISIRIPVLGDLAEKVILDHLRKNIDQEYGLFSRTLENYDFKDVAAFETLQ